MSDPRRPFSLDRYHVSEEYGFVLPDPLTELPSYYKPWMDIAQNLPDLIQAGVLRSRVRAMPLLDTHLLGGHRELRLAHLALSMMTMGYVWQEGESSTVKVLPRNLAVPYWDVSQRLGLPPILTHADGVLANWRKKNPEGPFDMENLELIATIPGGESARGFFMVTLLVELAAAPGLQAIPRVINEMRHRSTAGVTNALEDITQALASMTEALKLMHVYVDPAVFYSVMRIYLSG
ncbi:indoleamine 2,3-dioxygenase 2-like [Arapaima gigas]